VLCLRRAWHRRLGGRWHAASCPRRCGVCRRLLLLLVLLLALQHATLKAQF